MRQIKASEVKPGMTIRWEQDGAKIQLPVHSVEVGVVSVGLVALTKTQWCLGAETPVTVLSEPAPAQPEEPTALGARVVVGEHRFILVDNDLTPWLNMNTWMWYSWGELCNMGTVTVIDADPCWLVPSDGEPTPEVPERIEVWPEDDTALRKHKWQDEYGQIWQPGSNRHGDGWACGYLLRVRPLHGPWTRVTDA